MGRGEGSDACDAEGGASGAAAKPSWEWTCLALVRLLQQFPAGVSAAVMETQLVSQWQSQASPYPASCRMLTKSC